MFPVDIIGLLTVYMDCIYRFFHQPIGQGFLYNLSSARGKGRLAASSKTYCVSKLWYVMVCYRWQLRHVWRSSILLFNSHKLLLNPKACCAAVSDKSARNPKIFGTKTHGFLTIFPWNKSIVSYSLNKQIHACTTMYVYIYMYIHTYITSEIYNYVYIYICIYIYT